MTKSPFPGKHTGRSTGQIKVNFPFMNSHGLKETTEISLVKLTDVWYEVFAAPQRRRRTGAERSPSFANGFHSWKEGSPFSARGPSHTLRQAVGGSPGTWVAHGAPDWAPCGFCTPAYAWLDYVAYRFTENKTALRSRVKWKHKSAKFCELRENALIPAQVQFRISRVSEIMQHVNISHKQTRVWMSTSL